MTHRHTLKRHNRLTVLCVVVLIDPSLYGQEPLQAALDPQATLAKAADVLWPSVFTKCGDSLFFVRSNVLGLVLMEYRAPFRYRIDNDALSPADQLNGIQARGTAIFIASAARMFAADKKWTEWNSDDHSDHPIAAELIQIPQPVLRFIMRRKSGHWEFQTWPAEAIKNKVTCEVATSPNPFASVDKAQAQATRAAQAQMVFKVGGTVQAAKLISKMPPVYPPLARSAHIQGTVRFAATIDKEGKVQEVKLISGHPMLVSAAHDAVLQWQYAPTVINGSPVTVSTTIDVVFAP